MAGQVVRALIACEESQAVTIELRKLGIEAYSCDIEPCSGGHPEWHLQQDVLPLLDEDWDLLIAFPPCTHLAVSGAAWFAEKRADGRQQRGIDFFMQFANAKCPRIAIENPIGIMSTVWRKPDQIVHPYFFGDTFQKPTCLWLKNLPKLIYDKGQAEENKKELKWMYSHTGKRGALWNWGLPPSKDRAKIRSRTFPGIARAMAEQWSLNLTTCD
jgi:hypothetical protein